MNGPFSWAALFLLGLTGSLGHCSGMCGPLVLMVSAHPSAVYRPQLVWEQLLYHSARVLMYGAFGVLVGLLGNILGQGSGLTGVSGVVSIILGLLVIAFGFVYARWLRLRGQGLGAAWWSGAVKRVMDARGSLRSAALGALNALLPCGLVYGALSMSAASGSIPNGGLGMLLFGLGTMPVMVAIGLGGRFISASVRRNFAPITLALSALVGSQLILRGLAALGVIAHLHLGSLVLW